MNLDFSDSFLRIISMLNIFYKRSSQVTMSFSWSMSSRGICQFVPLLMMLNVNTLVRCCLPDFLLVKIAILHYNQYMIYEVIL